MAYDAIPMHLQEVHADLGHKLESFPQAEATSNCRVSIPMFPELIETEQDAAAVTGFTASQTVSYQLQWSAQNSGLS